MGRSNSEYSLDNSTIISEDISCGASSINTNSSNPVLDDLQTFRQALVMNDSKIILIENQKFLKDRID